MGKKSPAWKGGITPLKKQIYRNSKYKNWVKAVFKRDDYTCQRCSHSKNYLEAHHIKSFMSLIRKYKIKTLLQAIKCKELWDINNGIALCKECHELTKGFKGRRKAKEC